MIISLLKEKAEMPGVARKIEKKIEEKKLPSYHILPYIYIYFLAISCHIRLYQIV